MKRRTKSDKARCILGKIEIQMDESPLFAVESEEISIETDDEDVSKKIARGKKEEENIKRLGEHLNNSTKIKSFLPIDDEKRFKRFERLKIKFVKPNAETINAFNKGKTIEGIKNLKRVFIHEGSILIETSKMILKLKKGISFSDVEAEFRDKGLSLDYKLSFGKNLFSMYVTGNADPYLLSLELTEDPRVEYLEPDFLFEGKEHFSPIGNPQYVRQWHLHNIGLPNPNNANGNHPTDVNPNGGVHAKIGADANLEAAWDNAVAAPDGGLGIKIAILEGGFDATHPDLAASIDAVGTTTGGAAAFSSNLFGSIGFLRGAANIVDDLIYSHGDVCAGMAVARNNGAGGVGSAFDARFIPVTTTGLTFTAELYARCLVYIAHPGAEILNPGGKLADGADVLSISMTPSVNTRPSVIEEAMKYAVQFGRMGKGLVIVTAVPNEFIPSSAQSSVSGHDESIDVGDIGADDRYIGSAYGQNGIDLDVSNYGFQVFSTHIVNPAGGLVNSYPDYHLAIDDPAEPVGYAINQVGTSFATPLTAGIVALLLSRQPSLSWREVKEIVRTTAFPVNAGHNGRLAPYYNENGNPTYLGWKTADIGGLDIVDTSGHLILTGAATNLSAAVIAGVDGVVHGTFDLPVASSAGFAEGQAILIGAQTTLTAAPTLIGAQSLPVVSVAGFSAGQTIRVGSGVFTHLVLGAFVDDDELTVTDPSGFVVGDSIQIRKEVPGTLHQAKITQIKNSGGQHPVIKIDTPITLLFGACGQGDRLELAETREVKIFAVDVPNSKLLLDPMTLLDDPNNVYTIGTRVEIKSSEVRVIKAIDAAGPNTLRIDTLLFDHPIAAPVPVLGGRTPRYSRAYGFGRVDAAEAVDASRNYTHHLDHADMMIRDELVDTGLLDTVNPVDSPDVWVRNIDPVIDGANALPANYNTAGPHQDALADEDRYVYVRLKNIGVLPNFDFKVRIYVALVGTGSNPDFNFPVDVADPMLYWTSRPDDDTREIEDIRDGAKGIYLLEEKSFTAGDVPANTDTTFHVEWRKKDVPPPDSLLDSYLLVQITPFDGIKSNIEVKRNNNLTYKKIAIEERIKFKRYPNGEVLEELLQVGNYDPPTTIPFYIEIDEVQGTPFPTNKIIITIARKVKNGPNDSVKFHFNAGNWEFEGGVTPDWIFLEPPRGVSPTDPTPAAANTTLAYFVGHFDTSLTQKLIKFKVEVFDAADNLFFDDEHRIKFKFDVEEGQGFSNEKGAKFHFFTDTAPLQLQLDQASGGKPFGSFTSGVNDKFRVTSLHTANATAKAYAVCDGIVCCQDSITPGLINLILKPTKQPAISFAPIKYIIYKGIQKASLIDGVKIAAQATNKLTDHLWVTQQKTDASINSKRADMGLPALPAQDAPAKALGIHLTALLDPTRYADNHPIDNLFFRNDPDIQFPLVRGGWDIGEFNQPEFGLEIVFDSMEYAPKIEAARIIDHVLSFPQLPASPTRKDIFEGDALREEMLNYMDPCAFFGSFFESKLYVRSAAGTVVDTSDFDKKKGHDIYDAAIRKFANKNKIYVDIRNEYKHHLNFFDNYNDAIELSLSDQPFVDRIYKTQGWPILILDNSEFASNNNGKKDTISIGFPTSKLEDIGTNVIENRLPMVYISQGYKNQFLFPFKELKGKKKFVELETDIDTSGNLNFAMTKDQLELAVSNDNEEGGTTIVSSYIRLIYVKRSDIAHPAPPSSGTTIRGANPLDNHFRPLRLKIPFISAITFSNRSVVYDEEAYIDGLNSQAIEMDFIGKIGFSEDSQNVSLFTYAYDIHDKDKIKSNRPFTLVGENGNEDDSIKEISNKHDNIEVVKGNLTVSSSTVPYILLNDITSGFASFDKVDPREFQGVILTRAQFDTIVDIAEDPLNFDSQKFPVYLGFTKVVGDANPQQMDDNGNAFTRYELCLRGFLLVGSDYQVNEVLTTIIIYSNGTI
jgi:hypothetical protein